MLAMLLPVTAGATVVDPVIVNDTSRVVDLDEIIVIAQPKEPFRMRQQPLSSIVFGDEEMQRLNVHDLSALSAYVPSFTMPTYGSRLTSSIYMRGTGSRMNASNPSVPVYYDNIPLVSKSAFNSYYYMLDRVDVLRGPQGSLYGMNSEGGLVRVYSKNPMNYQGTDINLSLGNGLQRRAEVAHFHRPSERLAFSVAGFYHGQDGFVTNDFLNEKNDRMDEAGAKLRLIWNMTDRFSADVTADYQWVSQNAFPYAVYTPEETDVKNPSTTFMNTYRRNLVNTGLNLRYEGNGFQIHSTSSYQHLYDRMHMDQDYTPADRMELSQHQHQNAYTEELSVRSHNDSRWQWTFGAFGSYQDMKTDAPVTFGPAMNNMLANIILQAMPERVRSMFSVWEIPSFDVGETFKTPQTNLAAFHESNFRLTERLTATLGVRYDYNKAKVDYNSVAALNLHYKAAMGPQVLEQTNALTDSLIGKAEKSFKQLLPKFGLTWQVDNKGSNVYALVSKGYRAGGYNIQMFSDIIQTEMMGNGTNLQRGDYNIPHDEAFYEDMNQFIEYDPEISWNYEVGTHLNLFDGKLQADLSTYYMRISDLQLSKMAANYSLGRVMINAGKSSSCGLEAGLRGTMLDNHLSWAATYSYTRATFRDYKVNESEDVQIDYKDKHVPYVPEHMFCAMADYRFDVPNDEVLRSVTVGLNVAGNGKTYWNEENTAWQKLYATLGGHVLVDMGCVDVDFWGRNITDTRYCTFGLAYNNGYIGQRGLPMQLGIDVRMHF